MARVILINPWSEDEEGVLWNSEYQQNYWRNPYVGLIELATYLNAAGHPTKILDCERDLLIEAWGNPMLMLKMIESRIRSLRPDVVGVTGMTYRYPQAYLILRLLGKLKDELKIRIILGGRHAGGEPDRCLEDNPELDCVFHGRAEIGLRAYLEGTRLEDIPGIAYQENGQIRKTKNKYVEDLDMLPWANWSLIDVSFYTHPNIRIHRSKTNPLRSLDTVCSRGCNRACRFCGGSDGRPRWHSVEYILDFIRYTQRTCHTNATIFQDTSLGNNPDFLAKLCEGILTGNMQQNLIWTANLNATQVNAKVIRLMHKAGCRLVFVGFESGSDRMLKIMRKGTTVEDNYRCANELEASDMPYWASFIIGYPGETEEDIGATENFVDGINPTTGWANTFAPLPGSPVYEQLKQERRIEINSIADWVNFCRTGWGNTNVGPYTAMSGAVFDKYRARLQRKLQKITERGLERQLQFSS